MDTTRFQAVEGLAESVAEWGRVAAELTAMTDPGHPAKDDVADKLAAVKSLVMVMDYVNAKNFRVDTIGSARHRLNLAMSAAVNGRYADAAAHAAGIAGLCTTALEERLGGGVSAESPDE